MELFQQQDLTYIARVLFAGICGGLVGYERRNRGKGAGIRTHMIVALAAALMMVVSKYGFSDLAGFPGSGEADPSRVASSIVSGVGFLGAGIIYFQKNNITGLTTAAGIWATSGVGMAIGAGMYVIGAAACALIIIAQIILHKKLKRGPLPKEDAIKLVIENSAEACGMLRGIFEKYDIAMDEIKLTKLEGNHLEAEFYANLPHDFSARQLVDLIERDSVLSVKHDKLPLGCYH